MITSSGLFLSPNVAPFLLSWLFFSGLTALWQTRFGSLHQLKLQIENGWCLMVLLIRYGLKAWILCWMTIKKSVIYQMIIKHFFFLHILIESGVCENSMLPPNEITAFLCNPFTVVLDERWNHPDVQSDESHLWSNGSVSGLCEEEFFLFFAYLIILSQNHRLPSVR